MLGAAVVRHLPGMRHGPSTLEQADRGLFLLWLAYMGLLVFGAYLLWALGAWHRLVQADPTRLTLVIGEAVRVTRPGGHVALNYRTWTGSDTILWPVGKMVRASFKVPGIGGALARHRVTARFGWQANRLSPAKVLPELADRISDVRLVRSPKRSPFGVAGVEESTFEGVHRSHWWLIATVR